MRLVRRETRPGFRVKADDLLPLEVTDSLEKFKALIVLPGKLEDSSSSISSGLMLILYDMGKISVWSNDSDSVWIRNRNKAVNERKEGLLGAR